MKNQFVKIMNSKTFYLKLIRDLLIESDKICTHFTAVRDLFYFKNSGAEDLN